MSYISCMFQEFLRHSISVKVSWYFKMVLVQIYDFVLFLQITTNHPKINKDAYAGVCSNLHVDILQMKWPNLLSDKRKQRNEFYRFTLPIVYQQCRQCSPGRRIQLCWQAWGLQALPHMNPDSISTAIHTYRYRNSGHNGENIVIEHAHERKSTKNFRNSAGEGLELFFNPKGITVH